MQFHSIPIRRPLLTNHKEVITVRAREALTVIELLLKTLIFGNFLGKNIQFIISLIIRTLAYPALVEKTHLT